MSFSAVCVCALARARVCVYVRACVRAYESVRACVRVCVCVCVCVYLSVSVSLWLVCISMFINGIIMPLILCEHSACVPCISGCSQAVKRVILVAERAGSVSYDDDDGHNSKENESVSGGCGWTWSRWLWGHGAVCEAGPDDWGILPNHAPMLSTRA